MDKDDFYFWEHFAEEIYRMAVMPVENATVNLGADRFRTVREDLGDLLEYADTGSGPCVGERFIF